MTAPTIDVVFERVREPRPVLEGKPTATEALLSCAAAVDLDELRAARGDLITTGARACAVPDVTDLVSGDGTAGRTILAATGLPWHDHMAERSTRIRARLYGELAAARREAGER